MPILVPQAGATIPDGITDLESFRRWAHSDEFPERGRFASFNGKLWMDLEMERGFSHNQVKAEIGAVLRMVVRRAGSGLYFPDRMFVSHPRVGLATVPDGVFVRHETFERDEVRRVGGDGDDFTELVGTPDMVLEVVSQFSEDKDTDVLPNVYWRAGIAEFWLVDARADPLQFDINRRGSKGYSPTRRQAGGWLKSQVFGRSFQLTRRIDRFGDTEITLAVR